MNTNFADTAIAFNRSLLGIEKQLNIRLPEGFRLMNPFAQGQALPLSEQFYKLFYADQNPRRLILGINPGRHGAGVTGIPFTDSKRLNNLGIDPMGIKTYEASATFIYKLIEAYGGATDFYRHFYFNSTLPLGLLTKNHKGNWVNANYYDKPLLTQRIMPLIDYAMNAYQKMALTDTVVFCLGQSKNYQFLRQLNDTHGYFKRITPLPHPRYVVQYRTKLMDTYIVDFIKLLTSSE